MDKALRIARDALNQIIDNPDSARALAQFAIIVLTTLETETIKEAPSCHGGVLPVTGNYEIKINPTKERIWVIKQLRTYYPGLSLREAKEATDPLIEDINTNGAFPKAVYVYTNDTRKAHDLVAAINEKAIIASYSYIGD